MKLPLLISIPHGGTVTPDAVQDRVAAGPEDIFADGDSFTAEIYEVSDLVEVQLSTSIARAFVDLNRGRDQLPPEHPDGVVKSHTCFGKEVYKKPLDARLTEELLREYYDPYHTELKRHQRNPSVHLHLDCHSMLEEAPPVGPDPGSKRPLFCLGNRGGKSCPDDVMEHFGACLVKAFGLDPGNVHFNDPFSGGFITSHYGEDNGKWLQVEMNRKFYLDERWFDGRSLSMSEERLDALNRAFRETLRLFSDSLTEK